jgi:hypothetical protein
MVNRRTGLLVGGHLRLDLAVEDGQAALPVVCRPRARGRGRGPCHPRPDRSVRDCRPEPPGGTPGRHRERERLGQRTPGPDRQGERRRPCRPQRDSSESRAQSSPAPGTCGSTSLASSAGVHGQKPRLLSDDHPASVWVLPTISPGTQTDHPTSKLTEVFAIPMRQHTAPGEICYEPFSGSGSQQVVGG